MNTRDIFILQIRKLKVILIFFLLREEKLTCSFRDSSGSPGVLWGSALSPFPWTPSSRGGGAGFCWFPHQSLGVSRVGLLSPQKILWPISYCRVYGCWWSLGDFCLLLEPKELSGNIDSFHGPKSWGTERWGHFEQNWFLNFCFQARIYPIILK